MRICFVTKGNSSRGSYRYHNEIPARELQLLGHETEILDYPSLGADVYVFSKHFDYGNYWDIFALHYDGRKTVFHCCDNHFGGTHGEHYMRMIAAADVIIAPTEEMAKVIGLQTAREVTVIPDFYEYPLAAPTYSEFKAPLKTLWFGQGCNIGNLDATLPLPAGCELRLCTLFPNGVGVPKKLDKVPYMPWSYNNMLKSFEWADVVIIPFDSGASNITKSPNRLIEAVRQGKFVIASAIPSYLPFDEWMWIGDIHEGLEWAKTATDLKERVKAAQAFIEETHSPSRLGAMWESALK